MEGHNTTADPEFSAMQTVYGALEALPDDARSRVISYVVARLEIAAVANAAPRSAETGRDVVAEEAAIKAEEAQAPKFRSFAELFDATQPVSIANKALVAGYWLQVCRGAETFDGFSANKELANLGHRIANITNAIDSLKGQKPALVLQLMKSGKSQQARKTYKVTVSGIKAVEAMING